VMVASTGQPLDDAAPVPGARRADLDADLVDALVRRLRATRGSVFERASDDDILRMMRVLVDGPSGPAVTVAGLLALGRYPQQHFPQLDVTFVAFPTVSGEPLRDGTRFLDNQSIDGPIPRMVSTAVATVRRNLRRRSVITGTGRDDRWDYPEEAVRELVANALMHRDLHPLAQGTQVRIALYPDRLEIASPGGLHGPITKQDLFTEPISSSRNSVLAKLLEDVEIPGTGRTVCENRGSGLLAAASALRSAGIEPPDVKDSVQELRVVVRNEGLLDDDALAWLATIDATGLSDGQRLALAYVHRNGAITNQQFRSITGNDALAATRELSALATKGLVRKHRDRRWAVWRLVEDVAEVAQPRLDFTGRTQEGRREQITALLRDGPRSASELSSEMGITREGVLRWLRSMEAEGRVRPTEVNRKSRRNRWMLI
jgi:ATP-dependent DNA helicase RecG